MRFWKIIGIGATLIIILTLWFYTSQRKTELSLEKKDNTARFIGSASCRSCHEKEYSEWLGSHHERAMDIATEQSVLGDFNNTTFEHQGITSTFYKEDTLFFVRTQGPQGVLADYQITHTFGWYPLQQYLIPFPGGRMQCLPIAWDSRENKWFHVYGDEQIAHDEWRYWTNHGQTWNGMCADCHSTHLQKNYDMAEDTYSTTWSEISVGCEACHGPGSMHSAWGKLPRIAREQSNNGLVVSYNNSESGQQVASCILCHSRRTVTGDFQHGKEDILDSLVPRLLHEGLYYPDGQILEEVYVYGSFVQSQMYLNGVQCDDCHNIHSLKLHREGNELCLQCHEAKYYDSKTHHFHKKEGEQGDPIRGKDGTILFAVGSGASCVACHMPGRTYMGNDYRPDHSLRIPRPDLSVELGTPNSCNGCHQDKDAAWSSEFTRKWYGEKKRYHYGEVFAKAQQGSVEAKAALIDLFNDVQFPLLVRATALSYLGRYQGDGVIDAFARALQDNESLLRYTALVYFPQTTMQERIDMAAPLLTDPVLFVRIEAARSLSVISSDHLPGKVQKQFAKALKELKTILHYSADFAEARLNLGTLTSYSGNPAEAESQLQKALQIDPYLHSARNNLAILYSRQGKLDKAEEELWRGIELDATAYDLYYSLGLLLAEKKQLPQAVNALKKAAQGMANNARLFFNLGRLQVYLQQHEQAEQSFKQAVSLDPGNLNYLQDFMRLQYQKGDLTGVRQTAEKILGIDPSNAFAAELLKQLQNVTP